MFTGLIQCIGEIKARTTKGNEASLTISSDFSTFQKGESIAVNGVCLSVTSFHGNQFSVFASRETLAVTGMDSISAGAKVNLEKALTLSTPLGGHLVSGHVDTRVRLVERIKETEASRFRFSLPTSDELKYQIAPKGSITVDGVSLTVNDVTDEYFELMIIPITLAETTLGVLSPGAMVNIETDVLAKYISRKLEQHMSPTTKSNDISMETLLQNGFVR